MSQPAHEENSVSQTEDTAAGWATALGRVGVDWWATILALVIAALAVANVLPKIPW